MPAGIRWIAVLALASCSSSPTDPSPPSRTQATPVDDESVSLWAQLPDAEGLHVGARVTVAGIDVGSVTAIAVNDRGAQIEIAIRRPVPVWSDASLRTQVSATLGEHYLELDPGTESGDGGATHRLASGDEIANVLAGDSLVEELSEETREQLFDDPSTDEAETHRP